MESDAYCLVHGKKYCAEFQFIVNFLRQKVSKKSLNFTFASSVVCCCKHKDAVRTEKTEDCEGKKKRDKIEDFLKEPELKNAMASVLEMEDLPAKVKSVLSKWNERVQDADGLVLYGNSRIAGLMLLCTKGSYALLQNPVSETGRKGHEMTLPIYASLLGVYFGRKGKNIKDLCQKNNFLIHAEKRPASGDAASLSDAKITVVCKAEEFEKVQQLLIEKAKELQKARHEKKIAMALIRKRRK